MRGLVGLVGLRGRTATSSEDLSVSENLGCCELDGRCAVRGQPPFGGDSNGPG
jgi:hypothetical protein